MPDELSESTIAALDAARAKSSGSGETPTEPETEDSAEQTSPQDTPESEGVNTAEGVEAPAQETTDPTDRLVAALEAAFGRLSPAQKNDTTPTEEPPKLSRVNLEAFKDKFGDDPEILNLAESLNAAVGVVEQLQQSATQTQASLQQARQAQFDAAVDSFLSSESVKPYANFYGTGTTTPTGTQRAAREKLLETANIFAAGAQAAGKAISFSDAMALAHKAVSADFSSTAHRQNTVSEAKKRAASTLLTSSGAASDPPRKLTDEEIYARAADRLAKVRKG